MATPELRHTALTFPPPAVPLSVNDAPMSGFARNRQLKPWRLRAFAAGHNLVMAGWAPAPITVQATLPFATRRRRDPHNYTGTVVKSMVDGLVSAGVVPDDTAEWVTVMDPVLVVVETRIHARQRVILEIRERAVDAER